MDNSQNQAENDASTPSQPGNIIVPNTSPSDQPQEPQPVAAQPPAPIFDQSTTTEDSQPIEASSEPVPDALSQPASAFPGNVQAEEQMQAESEAPAKEAEISWVAPEFVQHDKNAGWYVTLLAATVIACGVFYVLSRDLVSAVMILVVMVIACVYSLRKPKNIQYGLNDRGMTIGVKNSFYGNFRSFTASHEGNFINITFIPLQRFSLPIGLCVDQQDGDKVVNFLADRLPLEKHNPDMLERLMLRIHF
jgi:hypothetical protein